MRCTVGGFKIRSNARFLLLIIIISPSLKRSGIQPDKGNDMHVRNKIFSARITARILSATTEKRRQGSIRKDASYGDAVLSREEHHNGDTHQSFEDQNVDDHNAKLFFELQSMKCKGNTKNVSRFTNHFDE